MATLLELILQFFRLDERLKDLFLGLEIGCVAEQCVLVLLKPLFGLDAVAAQVDQVYEHDEKDDHNGDRNGDLHTELALAVVICGIAETKLSTAAGIVENSVEWESRERSLAERCVLVAVRQRRLSCGVDAKDAKRQRHRVINVRKEHVVLGTHVVLVVQIWDLQIDVRHTVIVAIVAVAGVSSAEARVLDIFDHVKFVARVCLDHES